MMNTFKWLPDVEFSWMAPAFGFYVLLMGVVQLLTALALFFAHDAKKKRQCTAILAYLLLFDAVVTHFPFSELHKNFGKEMSHVCADIAILGGLHMMVGLPDDA